MIKAVVGVLEADDSFDVLMLKRKDTDRETAGWCFPGGKRDGVEDLKETLIREFWEETGLDVCPVRLILCADSGKYRIYAYEVVLAGTLPSELVLSKEHEDSAWVTPVDSVWGGLAGPVTERILNLISRGNKNA